MLFTQLIPCRPLPTFTDFDRVSKLSPQEQAAAIAVFSKLDETLANGIRLEGKKFFTISATPRSVYGKKGVRGRRPPGSATHRLLFCCYTQGDGCLLVKTKQAVLVAEYVAPIQAPEATPVVEALADYLINVSY